MNFKQLFFGKSDRTQKPKYESNWGYYYVYDEVNPSSILLDMELNQLAPIPLFEYLSEISVTLLQPNERGLPSNHEFETLKRIEDYLLAELDRLIFVGTVAKQGKRLFYFYNSLNDTLENELIRVRSNFPDYVIDINVTQDKEWEYYTNEIYPDAYYQRIMANQSVQSLLIKEGDDLSKERTVDHFLYFPTDLFLSTFLVEVFALGYIENSRDYQPDNDLPFMVEISRNEYVNDEHIHNNVFQLIDLAKKYQGDYDGWATFAV